MSEADDATMLEIITPLQEQLLKIQELQKLSPFDKRALAIAATQLETAMLWLANARQ